MAKSRRSLSLVRCVVFTLTALLISTIPLIADSIDERIKVLEVELQKAMKSTYLPNDEQLSRIKKEIDLLKMQQELDSIKSKRTQIPQIQEKQIPQYYESQTSQTQDSRFDWANQSNYQETKPKSIESQITTATPRLEVAIFLELRRVMWRQEVAYC